MATRPFHLEQSEFRERLPVLTASWFRASVARGANPRESGLKIVRLAAVETPATDTIQITPARARKATPKFRARRDLG